MLGGSLSPQRGGGAGGGEGTCIYTEFEKFKSYKVSLLFEYYVNCLHVCESVFCFVRWFDIYMNMHKSLAKAG
jgi:hypothetical protein